MCENSRFDLRQMSVDEHEKERFRATTAAYPVKVGSTIIRLGCLVPPDPTIQCTNVATLIGAPGAFVRSQCKQSDGGAVTHCFLTPYDAEALMQHAC